MKQYFNKKHTTFILLTTTLMLLLGAILGNTVFLKYKADAVLNLDMTVAEQARFQESVGNLDKLNEFMRASPASIEDQEALQKIVVAGGGCNQWHKPIPIMSKATAKDLPDALQKLEFERATNEGKSAAIYVGNQISACSANPTQAQRLTVWLANYYKEIAAQEALRAKVYNWISDNTQFSERANQQKIQYAFDIEQAQQRAMSLKRIIEQYPEFAKLEANQQVVDVRKDNEKFISPGAQLVGAESEIIDIQAKLAGIARALTQHEFVAIFLKEEEALLKKAKTGSEAIKTTNDLVKKYIALAKVDAQKEVMYKLAADVAGINAQYLAQAQLVANPVVPTRPESPRPKMLTVLFGMLGLIGSLIWVLRDWIIALLKEEQD